MSRSMDARNILRDLSEILYTYDLNINAMGREDMIITNIRLILEREVKKEPIWPEG